MESVGGCSEGSLKWSMNPVKNTIKANIIFNNDELFPPDRVGLL